MEETDDLLQQLQEMNKAYKMICEQVAKKVVGQQDVVEKVLIAMFANGHCLLLGVPGLAKTLLVSTLAQALQLDFKRIQFTPDLMPSDITGTEILDEAQGGGKRQLRFVKGPVFTNLLLADEINRTPPKTQAAMLEAMQERIVSNGGICYRLPSPFLVLATQNPLEQEGTYPLPEAQLDRFMFLVKMGYPTRKDEIQILQSTTSLIDEEVQAVISAENIIACQMLVRAIPVSDHVAAYCADLVRATRPGEAEAPDFVKANLSYGAGPRAGQYLMLGAKAYAALSGRFNVSCQDVKHIAHEVLRHRIACNFHAAGENLNTDAIVDMLLEHIPEPMDE